MMGVYDLKPVSNECPFTHVLVSELLSECKPAAGMHHKMPDRFDNNT